MRLDDGHGCRGGEGRMMLYPSAFPVRTVVSMLL